MIHHAKKSLSQNFLKSGYALRAMCDAASLTKDDAVLEIGPGKGALTAAFLDRGARVIAVEKDSDLVDYLNEKFTNEIGSGSLELIKGDILDFDPEKNGLRKGKYKIIANIPYNITGLIIRRFLSEVVAPEVMVLLVQKEVAERIVSRGKKESILSLSVQAYGTPKYIMKVPKRFFSPSPKVDSAIIAITTFSQPTFETRDQEEKFFAIIKAGFAHKRKVLRTNLESIAQRESIDTTFEECGISPKARAEDIPFHLWQKIYAGMSTDI
ncbi:MAG: 16S rRNA (adenine(1518)-N(6)/adenine(1519)-N(6))-dimethyltransferase RsmA [Patescibacteria group bacterium]